MAADECVPEINRHLPLSADEIYKETWLWMKERNCEKMVNPRLIEAYAQAFARYIQCEEATSTYGLLGKHPTTGGVITSTFVQMSQQGVFPYGCHQSSHG